MTLHQQFSVTRTIDRVSPERAIGYDVANAVSLLFDHIVHEGLNPADADLSTLNVMYERTVPAVRVSIYVKTEFPHGVDRFSLTP